MPLTAVSGRPSISAVCTRMSGDTRSGAVSRSPFHSSSQAFQNAIPSSRAAGARAASPPDEAAADASRPAAGAAALLLALALGGCGADGASRPDAAGRIQACKAGDQRVPSESACLQDDAACYALANGDWCTGERGNTCPAGSEALARAGRRRAALPEYRFIEPTRETRNMRSPTYRFTADALRALGPSVSYNRAPLDEIDRKVMLHLKEYERVSNRTLQNMLDVDVYRARDLLKRLVERGIIVRTSKATRGRSVEYGPGPRFDEGNGEG